MSLSFSEAGQDLSDIEQCQVHTELKQEDTREIGLQGKEEGCFWPMMQEALECRCGTFFLFS